MSLLTEFEQSFSARLNSGLQLLDNRLGDGLDTSNRLWHQVSLVEGGLLSATNLIAQLALSAGHLSDALNSSAHEVKLMNIAQSNAVQAADGLVAALQQMNETAMSALLDINATAIRVSQAIGVGYYSFFSNFLSLAGAIFLYLKQFSLLRLVASTVVVQHSPSFIATPCIVAILSMVRWSLKRILIRQGFRYPAPCVCSFKATSLESNQTSAAHLSPVTLTARATPWVRHRTFGWRSSQFSRIPDRLCGRRLDE
ncbi:hypothetical protein BC826DRAFT_404303 [Russula brevipes]|nr:hypothetical protein BC826DRAFT_404303 [Russula brevipes]